MTEAALRDLTLRVVYGAALARCGAEAARARAQNLAEAALITSQGAEPRLSRILSFARDEAGTEGAVPVMLAGLPIERRELVAWALVCRVEPPQLAELLGQTVVSVLDALTIARAQLLETCPTITDADLAGLALDRAWHAGDAVGIREGTGPGGKAFTLRAPLESLQQPVPGAPSERRTDPIREGATPIVPLGTDRVDPMELRPAMPLATDSTVPMLPPVPSRSAAASALPDTLPPGLPGGLGAAPAPTDPDLTPVQPRPAGRLPLNPDTTPRDPVVPLPLALREPPPPPERHTEQQWRLPGLYTTARPKGFEPLAQLPVKVVPAGQLHRGHRPFVAFGLLALLGGLTAAVVLKVAGEHRALVLKPALTVRQTVPAGTRLMPEMLVPIELPVEIAGANTIGVEDLAVISFQRLLFELQPGEPLHWSQLDMPRPRTNMADRVQRTARAYTLEVSEERAVGFHVRPGDRVDLIAVLRTGQGRSATVNAFVAAEDCIVLATGSPHPRAGLNGEYEDITLLVLPEEASRLALVRERGGFTFTLRGQGDHDPVEGGTLQTRQLLDAELKRRVQAGQ